MCEIEKVDFLILRFDWDTSRLKQSNCYYLIWHTPEKIVLEPLREIDAKWLFLESLKYIYLNHSRKIMEFVWFYWSVTSKCTWVTKGKSNLHPFTGVAQVQFFFGVVLFIIINISPKTFCHNHKPNTLVLIPLGNYLTFPQYRSVFDSLLEYSNLNHFLADFHSK